MRIPKLHLLLLVLAGACLAGCDGFDVNLFTVAADKVLEQQVDVFQVFLHLGPVFVRILTEHGQGALVLPRRQLLEVDIGLVQ